MFLEVLNLIAEFFGKSFTMMAQFNIGGFNLLSFFVVFAILDVVVSIFILKVEGNIMFSSNTWVDRNQKREHAEREAYRKADHSSSRRSRSKQVTRR